MRNNSESAYMLLSDQRQANMDTWFRSNRVLSPASAIAGNILSVTENTLMFGKSLSSDAPENMEVILLPLVGALQVLIDGFVKTLDIGEVICFTRKHNQSYQIANTYQEEIIAYLEIWVRSMEDERILGVDFDFAQSPNQLIALFDQPNVSIGQFDGRKDVQLVIPKNKAVFAYAVEGAFEFQNRLLQPRDAIILANHHDLIIDFEALSNSAILLSIIVDG